MKAEKLESIAKMEAKIQELKKTYKSIEGYTFGDDAVEAGKLIIDAETKTKEVMLDASTKIDTLQKELDALNAPVKPVANKMLR